MSLQGIFDPVVIAYYKKKYGGGSAVDDGYCIKWDGNTDGRDVIELNLGYTTLHFYKVSSLIIDADVLSGSFMIDSTINIGSTDYNSVLHMDGASILLNSGNPVVFSGKAGEYSAEGLTAILPSDGTYFANDSYAYKIRMLCKSATI